MRVDKWIWAVRMVKTRSLATELCRGGKVRINEQRTKPARDLKIGDIVSVSVHQHTKIYRVTGFVERRVSAKIAEEHYEDLSPPRPARPSRHPTREKGEGRPTKKQRRAVDKLRSS